MSCTCHSNMVSIMKQRCAALLKRVGGLPFYEPSTYYGAYKEGHYHSNVEYAGLRMASNISAVGSKYWSDFSQTWNHYFPCHMLPEENRAHAKHIVETLNTLKGEAWAYALCTVGLPDYGKHPLRQTILSALNMDAITYDATINMMRPFTQRL